MEEEQLDSYNPWPVDITILGLLPEQGSTFGGVHHQGRLAKDLAKEINKLAGDELVSGLSISARLRNLQAAGLALHVSGPGGRIWQRTPAGKAFYDERSAA